MLEPLCWLASRRERQQEGGRGLQAALLLSDKGKGERSRGLTLECPGPLGQEKDQVNPPQTNSMRSLQAEQMLRDVHWVGCACRRGSSVALMLDVRSLGTVEPICSVNTPREVTLHFLRTAGHPLTRWTLQHQPPSPKQLEEEFLVRIWGPLHITLRFHIRPCWVPWASLLLGVLGEEFRGSGEKVVPILAHPLCVQRVEWEKRRLERGTRD